MPSIEIKTLCVIGGSGFVGSHVIAKALQNGWKVGLLCHIKFSY